ncbi:MAG: hypothetical protein L6Q99_02135 [Planctomycetes bacterium]|nr:hypothetical protein [Planctomycetota bacterium]
MLRVAPQRAASERATSERATRRLQATGPREHALRAFVAALDAAHVEYVVLRGRHAFPALAPGGDLDLLVRPKDATRVVELALGVMRAHGVSVWEHRRVGSMVTLCCHAFAGRGEHQFFGLDVHTAETCYGVPFLSAEEGLADARRDAELPAPAPARSACIDALGAFLSSGTIPERHAASLRRAVGLHASEVERELARWFGRSRAADVLRAVRASPDFAERLDARSLRRALIARALRRAPLRASAGFLRFAWDVRVQPWFAPRGRFVAFLGTDGTGKSTVLAGVRAAIERAYGSAGVAAFHLRPGLLPQLNALLHGGRTSYSLADMDRPHRAAPSGRFVSTLRVAYYVADYVLGGWLRVRPLRRRPTLVTFDRYAYDYLVDPLRSRIRLDAPFVRALCGLCPRPDRVLVCDAPFAVVRARKQELSESETARQLAGYAGLARSLPNAVVVSTDGDVQDSIDAALRAIFEERTR